MWREGARKRGKGPSRNDGEVQSKVLEKEGGSNISGKGKNISGDQEDKTEMKIGRGKKG